VTVALGLTFAEGAPPDAIIARPAHLAVVTAPSEKAGSGQARLALQVAYAHALPSFLPFKPRDAIRIGVALDHVALASKQLGNRLETCRGLVQFTVALTPPAEAIEDDSMSWLRGRAAALKRRSIGTACMTKHLGLTEPRHIGSTAQGRLIHVVGDRGIGPRIERVLADCMPVAGATALRGFKVSVTGPWPIFANFDESAMQ
jgi:hypothetical protein